jgi:hypothetical protein
VDDERWDVESRAPRGQIDIALGRDVRAYRRVRFQVDRVSRVAPTLLKFASLGAVRKVSAEGDRVEFSVLLRSSALRVEELLPASAIRTEPAQSFFAI